MHQRNALPLPGLGAAALRLVEDEALNTYPQAIAVHAVTVAQVLTPEGVSYQLDQGPLDNETAISILRGLVRRHDELEAEAAS